MSFNTNTGTTVTNLTTQVNANTTSITNIAAVDWALFEDPTETGDASDDAVAALRRHGLVTRHDYEVPVGRCIDWLSARDDVDASRIAVSGSSLGGYYAARAGAMAASSVLVSEAFSRFNPHPPSAD